MDKRVWWVVGLFGGVIAMIVVWLALTSSTTPQGATRPKAPLVKERKLAKINPQLRQQDVARIRQNPAMRPIERADGTPVRPSAPPVPRGGPYRLDQDGIAAAVDEQRSELSACYETALFHTPGLSGQMTLVLKVEPVEGQAHATVEAVDLESNLDAPVLEGCIATVFEDLQFAATESTTVRYPVTLSVDDEGEPDDAQDEPGAEDEGAAPDEGAP